MSPDEGPGLSTFASSLSPAIADQIEKYCAVLGRQGVLQPRLDRDRQPSWRIRVRVRDENLGCVVHRSIPLGHDEGVAFAAQAKLDAWKSAWRRQHDQERAGKAVKLAQERLNKERWKHLRKLTVLTRGGSRRERRRTGKELDEAMACTSPVLSLSYALGIPIRRPPKPRGRPHKCRLW